jgi:hypothetical protein
MPDGVDLNNNISGDDGLSVCRDILQPNAERIVACVNACRGIPTKHLEEVIWTGKRQYADEYQRAVRFGLKYDPFPEEQGE